VLFVKEDKGNPHMTSKTGRSVAGPREAGFALILALLALMLLTFLGLTLATMTSSELQIASNYRWGQQAMYNAEAGIEAGKIILRNIPNDWGSVLPAQRGGSWSWGTPPGPSAAPSTTATRNYENAACDGLTGSGYGAVLDDRQATPLLLGETAAGPYENVKVFRGLTLKGAFTLWVRRDLKLDSVAHSTTEGQYSDSPDNKILILLSEGSAPGPSSTMGAAVRVLQVRLVLRPLEENSSCSAAEGQTGIAASGANFGACAPLNASSIGALVAGGSGAENTGVK
jgi:hypothetical protein